MTNTNKQTDKHTNKHKRQTNKHTKSSRKKWTWADDKKQNNKTPQTISNFHTKIQTQSSVLKEQTGH